MKLSIKNAINSSTDVSINASAPLGRGADAFIYKANIAGNQYAAKIYHDSTKLDVKKLIAMISNPPKNLIAKTARVNYPAYAWPVEILYEKNKAVGFLMPLVDLQNSFTLDYYYDPGLIGKLNSVDEYALSYRVEIAANLSNLLSDLHSQNHFFIDLKPQNIRVFKKTHAVTLIDCDGFSIFDPGSKRSYPATMFSADYISPEALRGRLLARDLGEGQDLFALATIIFQLFNGGIHPFQGILLTKAGDFNTNDEKVSAGLYPHGLKENLKIKPRPQSVHECFHDETRVLFDRAFIGPENLRPTAKEWADHLNRLYKGQQLSRCDKFPNDVKHMRWKNKPCPCCVLEQGKQQAKQLISKLPSPVKPVASTFKSQQKSSAFKAPKAMPAQQPTNVKKAKSDDWHWSARIAIGLLVVAAIKSCNSSQQKVACNYYPAYSKTSVENGKCKFETTTSGLQGNQSKRQTLTIDIKNAGEKKVFFTYYKSGAILTQSGSLANKGYWSYKLNASGYPGWIGIETSQNEAYWFKP